MKTKRFIKKEWYKIKGFVSNWRKLTGLLLTILLTAALLPFILHFWVSSNYSNKKYENIDDVPNEKVAIVFGAGLKDNKPGKVLGDRVLVAVDLYKARKIQKIIMSGDNRADNYDEPTAMAQMAKENGVPENAIEVDHAGKRTYDTCYRAKTIFKIDDAILVTQDFHMDRALYLCNSLGIDSVGVLADRSDYPGETKYRIRDYFALVKAIWEINVDRPDNVSTQETAIIYQ